MAVKPTHTGRFWSRVHFFVRLLGLTGFVALVVGLVVGGLNELFADGPWKDAVGAVREATAQDFAPFQALPFFRKLATGLILGGGLFAVFVLLVEVLNVLFFVAGRRSVVGFNAVLQSALAIALLVAVNVFSAGIVIPTWDGPWRLDGHYARIDTTHDQQFTLPDDIKKDLARLQGETKIVVYLSHKNFGQSLDRPDPYFFAAERKVTEKVQDAVALFSELGPRFNVVVLDVADVEFQKKLEDETRKAPALRDAINATGENTIFFEANNKVQRLAFNEFAPLDHKASLAKSKRTPETVVASTVGLAGSPPNPATLVAAANLDVADRGNLVLRPQGFGALARRILNVDERKPRVAILVTHPLLSSQSELEVGLQGLRKSLVDRGFEVRDIVAKKGWEGVAAPEPAVLTFDESRADDLDAEDKDLEVQLREIEADRTALQKELDFFTDKSLDEISKRFAAQLQGRKLKEEERQLNIRQFRANLANLESATTRGNLRRTEIAREKSGLKLEQLDERRRLSDLKAKLGRELADCDLLLIPRVTMENASQGWRVPPKIHLLSPEQADAVKDFLKLGKPVLACLGPTSGGERDDFPGPANDELETMLGQLGFRLNKQTILYDVESKANAARRAGLLPPGGAVEIPPAELDWEPTALPPLAGEPSEKLNPIRTTMRVLSRASDNKFELRLRRPRPVDFAPPAGAKESKIDPVFLISSADSWNEDDPFPAGTKAPTFEGRKTQVLSRSLEGKLKGPFPIAVAAEVSPPASWWTADKPDPTPSARVAVIGHSGFLTGQELNPVREAVLLNTCNWLLGRDDRLPQTDRPTWQYPRVPMSELTQSAWTAGAIFGLPGLFAFLGVVVLLYRQLR